MRDHRNEQVIGQVEGIEGGRPLVGLVLVLGFLLASIVGMSSASSPWPSDGDSGSSASVPDLVGNVLALALAVGVCALVALLWISTPRRAKGRARAPAEPVGEEVRALLRSGSLVLLLGVVATVFVTGAVWLLLEQANLAQPAPAPTVASTPLVSLSPAVSPSSSPALRWFALGLAGSITVLLPLGLVIRHRRRASDPADDAVALPESVVRALGDSIDQIERDPDSRRAIIRAYAQMENAFDEVGIPRQPYEAPFEYVGRALRSLRVSAPAVGRLAALFEGARFSRHVVGTETKADALGALREIEKQLKEPSA
jgi:hypothetical protein